MDIRREYESKQVDLACLDTLCGDYREYGACLDFAWRSSAVQSVIQMQAVNGSPAFEMGERETDEEFDARWRFEAARRAALKVAA